MVEIGAGEVPQWWASVPRFRFEGNPQAYSVAENDFSPRAALDKLHDSLDALSRSQEPPMPDTGPIPMPYEPRSDLDE